MTKDTEKIQTREEMSNQILGLEKQVEELTSNYDNLNRRVSHLVAQQQAQTNHDLTVY